MVLYEKAEVTRTYTMCLCRYLVQGGEQPDGHGSGELTQEQDFAQPSAGGEYLHSLVHDEQHQGYDGQHQQQQQHHEDMHVIEFGAADGQQEDDDAYSYLQPHPKRKRSRRLGV